MKISSSAIEILESRIAPAAVPLPGLPSIRDAVWKNANAGQPDASGQTYYELSAGQGLSTAGDQSGVYLLFVEKGNCLVFATDLNYSGTIEANEITGISAGNGLRLISFVDIHGDIVTNLKETSISSNGVTRLELRLSDSDNNPANDTEVNGNLKGDGRVVLNNTIEKIEFRALNINDIPDQNGDGIVSEGDVLLRQAFSTFSLYGNIYAGRGFGVPGDPTSGLFIDQTGELLNDGFANHPMVNGIKVGTAASGEYFSFGVSNRNDIQGMLMPFTPPTGQTGAHIAGITLGENTEFNINYLIAGRGGVGAAGGAIRDISLKSDGVGGYVVVAGDGGDGPTGGTGGAIINFSDAGSVTGKVIIKSGDGGTGTTGAGGNATQSLFGPLNLRGNIAVELGNGGNGFTSGGAGASITAGTITAPDEIFSGGAEVVGTTRYPSGTSGTYTPRIGNTQLLDFNNDGIGDLVFTTTSPSQIVIQLGVPGGFQGSYTNQYGTFSDRAIFLPGYLNSEALTVGDFNGDGHPDIAVASGELSGGLGGIVVYLAKYEDVNGDGVVSGSENVLPDSPGDTYDQQNDFLGFYDGRFSQVPNGATGFSLVQINKLQAGDFDGDGKVDIALLGTYGDGPLSQGIMIMTADREPDGRLTGQFFPDFGLYENPNKYPYIDLGLGEGGSYDMQATALSGNSLRDVLVVAPRRGQPGGGSSPITYGINGGGTLAAAGTWTLGQVDVNRNTGVNDIALVDYNIANFTLGDYDGDNNVDLFIVTGQPLNFLTMIKGNGTGSGVPDTGTGQNAGIFFDIQDQLRHIITGDYDADGVVDDIAVAWSDESVHFYRYDGVPAIGTVAQFAVINTNPFNPQSPATFVGDTFAFGNYISSVTGNTATYHVTAGLSDGQLPKNLQGEFLFVQGRGIIYYQADSFALKAGSGGDSFAGRGGNGGSIGGGLTLSTTTDPVTGEVTQSLVGALNFTFEIGVTLYAGHGGSGFSSGGNGGSITGVSIFQTQADYNPILPDLAWTAVPSFLYAGNGGRGVSGAGGNGGNISNVSIDEGEIFQAGNGGVGKIGGDGGSVIGNGRGGFFDPARPQHGLLPIVGFYDTATFGLEVIAGNGGDGTKRGGHGGSIRNFAAGLLEEAYQSYTAGNGGNAVNGPGGNGGSVLNSSPLTQNYGGGQFDADLVLRGGNGGNGTSGGHGGNVTNFVDNVGGVFDQPSILTIVSGHGGNGVSGPGGNGGSISGIDVGAFGLLGPAGIEAYAFNRMLAGNGGSSSSGKGGNGGNITNVNTGVGASAYAVVAGAGGDGLFNGGTGGLVSNLVLASGGGTIANILIAGGAGGDASAFAVNPKDLRPDQDKKFFGGKVGVGGNGGSVTNVRDSGSALGHFNIISGDGGDTITYGTPGDTKAYVGRGGNIANIRLTGDLGNITGDATADVGLVNDAVPIKSYNDILSGESFKDWALDNLYTTTPVDSFLDDYDGNVGIVVGIAGRNKAIALDPVNAPMDFRSQPATGGKNGDLVNVSAKNLLAAVAGSVDRIAAINSIKGLFIAGTVGAEKNPLGSTQATDPNYLDENGLGTPAPFEPVLQGRLVDGAVIAHSILSLSGSPVTIAGKVFKR